MTRPVFRPAFYPAFRPTFNNLKSISAAVRSAYNFDGVDDRGALLTRAINPDGDNTFEFFSPAVIKAPTQAIVAQNITSTISAMEFQLFVAGGTLEVVFGGGARTALMTAAQGFATNTKYGLTLIGTEAKLYLGGLGGTLLRTVTFPRGAAREPSAVTTIGCRTSSGTFANFFEGKQHDIKINGVFWPIEANSQILQLPLPNGLGADLITPAVHAAPVAKGSQWTHLGDGRWEYVGDGTGNSLAFLPLGSIPETGWLEYEVESFTRTVGLSGLRWSATTANWAGDRVFASTGKKRAFFTAKPADLTLTRNTPGDVISCVIKNISFKPLGTCNPLILANITPDRWEEVPA